MIIMMGCIYRVSAAMLANLDRLDIDSMSRSGSGQAVPVTTALHFAAYRRSLHLVL